VAPPIGIRQAQSGGRSGPKVDGRYRADTRARRKAHALQSGTSGSLRRWTLLAL